MARGSAGINGLLPRGWIKNLCMIKIIEPTFFKDWLFFLNLNSKFVFNYHVIAPSFLICTDTVNNIPHIFELHVLFNFFRRENGSRPKFTFCQFYVCNFVYVAFSKLSDVPNMSQCCYTGFGHRHSTTTTATSWLRPVFCGYQSITRVGCW